MNLKVVQEVVVPKVTVGIIEHPPIFKSKGKITSLEAGTCAVYLI